MTRKEQLKAIETLHNEFGDWCEKTEMTRVKSELIVRMELAFLTTVAMFEEDPDFTMDEDTFNMMHEAVYNFIGDERVVLYRKCKNKA